MAREGGIDEKQQRSSSARQRRLAVVGEGQYPKVLRRRDRHGADRSIAFCDANASPCCEVKFKTRNPLLPRVVKDMVSSRSILILADDRRYHNQPGQKDTSNDPECEDGIPALTCNKTVSSRAHMRPHVGGTHICFAAPAKPESPKTFPTQAAQ